MTTVRFLEALPERSLPPKSRLGEMYARKQVAYDDMQIAGNILENLKNEHNSVQRLLERATLETVSPEEFAGATAREILLARAIDTARFKYQDAINIYEGVRQSFDDAYEDYRRKVQCLREGQSREGLSLTSDDVNQYRGDIERVLAV
jgi:hypothetical protein